MTVVLVPDDDTNWEPSEYKTAVTDQYGHYEVRGIPPGGYKAYAFEKADEEQYGEEDDLKPFASMAAALDFSSNDHKSADLKMIPANADANYVG